MYTFKKLPPIIFFICIPILSWAQQSDVNKLVQLAVEEKAAGSSAGKVLAHWLQAYEAIKDEDQHPQYPVTCIYIADIYSHEQLNEQALPYYLKAFHSLKKSEKLFDQSQGIHQKIAQVYALLSKPDSAAYYYDQILIQKEKTGNLNGQINTLQKISKAFTINKLYANSLNYNLRIMQLMDDHQRPVEERLLALNNLGYTYNNLKQYKESISYFKKAMALIEKKDFPSKTILNTNIGIAYYNLGEFETSIDYLIKARKYKSKYAPSELDEIDQLIATVYLEKKDLHNALNYAEQSESIALANNNYTLLTDVYYTSALIHSDLYEYDLALEYFQKHLSLRDSFALDEKLRQQQLLQQQINLERTEKQIKLFLINEDVKELTISQLETKAENQQLALKNKEVQILAEQKEKEILRKENELKVSELKIQESETKRARQELELARQSLKVSRQEKENVALQQKEALQELEIKNKENQLKEEQNEKNLLLRDNEISTLELQKRKEREQFFYGLGALMALILLIIAGGLVYSRRLNHQLSQKNIAIEQQKEEINQEKKKSDNLLLNILPKQIAAELRETGKATTKKHENVTILFTDFKNFTPLVASIPARTLVKELNDIFSFFDDVMEEFQIEKIETIGDAYLAACGLPEENSEHAVKCVKAAHKMLAFLKERNIHNEIQWNMRVGIHSGPVIAGVVGKKKFAYDLFGDTVNTASRIETNGEAGKVNISHTTYELIKSIPELSFENRGKIHAKGKGEIEMWFVN